jgi:hypothetical protein
VVFDDSPNLFSIKRKTVHWKVNFIIEIFEHVILSFGKSKRVAHILDAFQKAFFVEFEMGKREEFD